MAQLFIASSLIHSYMNIKKAYSRFIQRFIALIVITFVSLSVDAQEQSNYVRIARIVVKQDALEKFQSALKEGMETSVAKEPGVLSLRAMYDKKQPTHITVFEIYADLAAYNLHIQTPHFKKYKDTVADMVLSLELIDVEPISFQDKAGKKN